MIADVLLALRLCLSLLAYSADQGEPLPAARVCSASSAIVATAGSWDPALIGALAWAESRLDPHVVNARGCWGPLQVCGRHRPRGITERASYAAGVRRLDEARAFCLRRGDRSTTCALAGFASGPAGVRGRWYARPRATLRRAEAIRRVMLGQRPGPATWRAGS